MKIKNKFILTKKDNNYKSAVTVYFDNETLSEINRICQKTGYSKSELIYKMCKWSLENLELIE